MKFTFLGTAASEQYPAIFCTCEYCSRARALGGRNIRALSCAHLAPDTMIDFNNSAPLRALQFGVSLPDVQYALITHAHGDHFAPTVIRCRRMSPGVTLPPTDEKRKLPDYVGVRFCELPMLHVYGDERVRLGLQTDGKDPDPAVYRIEPHVVDYGETFAAGDMRCLALAADHNDAPGKAGLIYVIQRAGRTILYALDTGWYPEETLRRICEFQYDLVVVEGTFGLGREAPQKHFNFTMVERAHALFQERGLLKQGAPFCVSHICPHWTPPHDDIAPIMAAKGITIAYDGLSFEI